MSSSQPSPTTTVPHGVVVPVDVHFDDLDAMGVLHNARYAVLVERALSSAGERVNRQCRADARERTLEGESGVGSAPQ